MKLVLINSVPIQKGRFASQHIPLGIAYISAVLKENGQDVKVIDPRFSDCENDLISTIEKQRPDIIGFSFITPFADISFNRIKSVKERLPDCIIVAGGPHPTVDCMNTIKESDINFLLLGESEYSFLELIEELEKRRPNLKKVDGIIFKKSGRVVVNKKRRFIENLDELPFPARELFPLDKIFRCVPVRRFELYPYANLFSSRGCPFNCNFCQPTKRMLFGNKLRFRSAGNLVDEIDYLNEKYKLRYFDIDDDTFTNKRSRVMEFCDELVKRGLDIKWLCQTRSDKVDRKLLLNMRKAGCYAVLYGIESGSQKILDLMNKNVEVQVQKEAVKDTNSSHIISFANIMLGYPGEDEEDLKRTLEFLNEVRPDYTVPNLTSPFIGTHLYHQAREQNLILISRYEQYLRGYFGGKMKISISKSTLEKYRAKIARPYARPRLRTYYVRNVIERMRCHLAQHNYAHLAIESFLDLKYYIRRVKPAES